MNRSDTALDLPRALLAGAVTGALVLGLAGRAVTAVVAFAAGGALNVSARGAVEVVIVGTLAGALGGALLLPARRVMPGSRVARGVSVGAALFATSLLLAWARGTFTFTASRVQLLTMSVVAVVFMIYGIAADALFDRRGR